MFVSAKLAALIIAASLAAITLPARADDRTLLNACQVLIDRATSLLLSPLARYTQLSKMISALTIKSVVLII